MHPPSKFSFFHKAVIISLVCAIVYTSAFIPFITFAQANQAPLPENNTQAAPSSALFELTDPQAQTVQTGGTINPTTASQAKVTDLAKEGLTCSAGTLLAQVLSSAISAALSEIATEVIKETATKVVKGVVYDPVPTAEKLELLDVSKRKLDYVKLGSHAEKGVAGPFGIYINVSWDAIAYCVVNAMIEYIANATIAWANSGFNGNPAFLENPERFFRDLADYQAGKIIKDIAYGASGGAVNVCQPFKVNIAINLAQSYPGYGDDALNSSYRGMSCRLSDITQKKIFQGINVSVGEGKGNVQQALSWTDWNELTQNDANNPYGAYILANQALYASVAAKNNELRFEISANNGWLNFKKCPDGEKDLSKCNTVTPGTLIQSSLEKTLNLSKDRLVLATKFDQMITAIVNNLIKVALDKVLEGEKKQ